MMKAWIPNLTNPTSVRFVRKERRLRMPVTARLHRWASSVVCALLAARASAEPAAPSDERTRAEALPRAELIRYASATWHSFTRMTMPQSGLPVDSVDGRLSAASRVRYTSPTNIAMYLWGVLAARDLGLITPARARRLAGKTLNSIARLERHEPSGQFYNWYDPVTLKTLVRWPEAPFSELAPFVSSVDNAWLAAALVMVANAMPEHHAVAWKLARAMSFACFYDATAKGQGAGAGLLRGGFWRQGRAPLGSDSFPRGDYCGMGEDVVYTPHHYGMLNTEPRIASYLGIALGQLPPEHYFATWRTVPDTCDWAWTEARPRGQWTTYLGVNVFEGAYLYEDKRVLPSWGGSLFEALMPALVVPEEQWGPSSWGINHPLYVESQLEFGQREAGGFWGFSPASVPGGGYGEFGVDALGMNPAGYTADGKRSSNSDGGWDDDRCQRPKSKSTGERPSQGIVTPHAAFLALDFAPEAVLQNLRALRRTFPKIYGPGGFKDSLNVSTGEVAERYLSLDQGMVLAAIANALVGDRLQRYLAVTLEPTLRPLMAMEQFAAGRITAAAGGPPTGAGAPEPSEPLGDLPEPPQVFARLQATETLGPWGGTEDPRAPFGADEPAQSAQDSVREMPPAPSEQLTVAPE